jgi:hypothetical protein
MRLRRRCCTFLLYPGLTFIHIVSTACVSGLRLVASRSDQPAGSAMEPQGQRGASRSPMRKAEQVGVWNCVGERYKISVHEKAGT